MRQERCSDWRKQSPYRDYNLAFVAIRGFAPITPVPPKARNRAFFCVDIAYRRCSFGIAQKNQKASVFHSMGAPWAQHTPLNLWKSGCRISKRDTLALFVDCSLTVRGLFVDILRLLNDKRNKNNMIYYR